MQSLRRLFAYLPPVSKVRPILQVRSAYRRRGWGFTDPQQISQCAKEGFVEKLKAQEGEGCHTWGTLAVNKASHPGLQLLRSLLASFCSRGPTAAAIAAGGVLVPGGSEPGPAEVGIS